MASPIVAVGEVINTRIYGVQTVSALPPPMSQYAQKLYWCQGVFKAVAVVKGELNARPPVFLWASGVSGCKLSWPNDKRWYDRRVTKVWFLREEGGFLRPTYDGGRHFIGLFTKWMDGPDLPNRQRLGAAELLAGQVKGIAAHWNPQMPEMHPDLIRAPGQRPGSAKCACSCCDRGSANSIVQQWRR